MAHTWLRGLSPATASSSSMCHAHNSLISNNKYCFSSFNNVDLLCSMSVDCCMPPRRGWGTMVGGPVHRSLHFFFWRAPFPSLFCSGVICEHPKTDRCQTKRGPFFAVAIFQLISSSAGQSIQKLAAASACTI